MKKVFSLVLIFAFVLCICSCKEKKSNDPSPYISGYLDALKANDTEGLAKYGSSKTDLGIDGLHLRYKGGIEAILSHLEHKILSFTLNSDGVSATAEVEITTVDIFHAMAAYMANAKKMFDEGEGLFTDDDYAAVFVDAVNAETATRTFNVTVTAVRKGNDWVLRTDNEHLLNAVTGGLLEFYDSIEDGEDIFF